MISCRRAHGLLYLSISNCLSIPTDTIRSTMSDILVTSDRYSDDDHTDSDSDTGHYKLELRTPGLSLRKSAIPRSLRRAAQPSLYDRRSSEQTNEHVRRPTGPDTAQSRGGRSHTENAAERSVNRVVDSHAQGIISSLPSPRPGWPSNLPIPRDPSPKHDEHSHHQDRRKGDVPCKKCGTPLTADSDTTSPGSPGESAHCQVTSTNICTESGGTPDSSDLRCAYCGESVTTPTYQSYQQPDGER
ncbi:hypothetical protein C8Q76DRAFT_198489 [Earliella scabrosa]|nr:hypothetical protein C8Q76DRAFT_198489 [Earliella scabrosa]